MEGGEGGGGGGGGGAGGWMWERKILIEILGCDDYNDDGFSGRGELA